MQYSAIGKITKVVFQYVMSISQVLWIVFWLSITHYGLQILVPALDVDP